jgi:hypothetical protein
MKKIELYYVVKSFSKSDQYEYVAGPYKNWLSAYQMIEDTLGVVSSKHYHVAKQVVDMEMM